MSASQVPPGERGAALLTVLLIVAIVGAIAAAAFERLRLSTALSANAAGLQQARAYAMGIEALLILRVGELMARSDGAIALDKPAERRIPLPEGGAAEGRIHDASSCFNLNSLVEGDPASNNLASRPLGVAQFAALMEQIGFSADRARSLAGAAADWADSDQIPNPGGAEDVAYSARGYRTADTLFSEASELRAVTGITIEDYERLRPFVCALPVAELSRINVNSLNEGQAPLLSMIVPGLTTAAAHAALAERPARGWGSIADFWAAPGVALIGPSADPHSQLQTSTHWFALELQVEAQGTRVVETALIDARRAVPVLHSRRWTHEE